MDTELQRAVRAYDNPACQTVSEFETDYKIPTRIKRLLGRMKRSQPTDFAVRTVVSYMLSWFNVFEPKFAVDHLYERCGQELFVQINTFLVYFRRSWNFVEVDSDLAQRISRVLKT